MTLKPTECMYHSVSLNGSPFAFRIKFKLVSLVAEGLYDLAPNVLQPQLPPYYPCYFPRGTVSTSRPITSLLSTTVHVIPTPRMSPLLSPLCLTNSYPPPSRLRPTIQVHFSIKIFIWAPLAPSPTTSTLPTLWEILQDLFTQMSQDPGLYTEWAHSKYFWMNEWCHWTTLHIMKNDNSHRVRFSNKLSQAVPDSEQMRDVKRSALHPHQESAQWPNCMLSPGKDLKFNQKRKAPGLHNREAGWRSEQVSCAVKDLRAQPQRTDLARKLPSALQREHLAAFIHSRMFWHNYWTYPQDLEDCHGKSSKITSDPDIATSGLSSRWKWQLASRPLSSNFILSFNLTM